jgi:hypothetical protein
MSNPNSRMTAWNSAFAIGSRKHTPGESLALTFFKLGYSPDQQTSYTYPYQKTRPRARVGVIDGRLPAADA